ncbi:MAG: hypothetical protein KatS3mg068_1013 [Candidatus Sericytochromatia bacterium]|nr:MAG: hypothetical protein KatS3mg068_1013 [Candidatus Sericytochromatia bacterium]
MNINIIKTIFLKELIDTIRDSRTLFVMLILPLMLYPLLSISAGQIIISQTKQIQSKIINIGLKSDSKNLLNFIKKNKDINITLNIDNPIKAIEEEKINIFLETENNFDKKTSAKEKNRNKNLL